MKRKRTVLLTGVMIILAASALLLLRKPAGPEKDEKLRIGVFADSICALIYIAQERGFFKRHGLDLAIENYQTGIYAVNDLQAGKVDLATAAGLVLALKGFGAKDLRAIATISSSDNVEVVARRDRGIEKPEDLAGKRIGVTKGTITEYFLSTFLSFTGIFPSEIRRVNLKPSEIVTTLSEGKIDAACGFPPFTDAMKKNLAHNAISWPAQGGQDYYFLLMTGEELTKTRPRTVVRLLKGVLEAEDFLKTREKESQEIVTRMANIDPDVVRSTWAKTHFRVSLDQNLLTLMEDEARWAITNKLIDSTKVPNYFPFLHLEGLKKIKPEAVGVIH